ncbi:MAG: peptidylprolyl isomerase [Ignavibacterium sp.]|jgi:FKBP-type peptidyl-prolyl cis-trans isomerase SlyD|uniref:Peptidyl-prolyl cis-trans isomerase n=1 Tax=Ignavibacterium album TaxID=591197 RepID=A0A7V2ZM54_9BACT|nr:peptidylprolyl isomerase [Ignavibacterium album]MCA2004256.1 peptidylprolyl isomerase [Ignavibacterium sp.]MCX8104769.1 peptidylprolyl isomerase [Ignavibacterium album]
MPIGANKVVTLNFTLKDEQGNILDTTENAQPFSYISGQEQILPKLEAEVDTMLIGGKKHISIPATEAYGEYNEEVVQVVGRENFPQDFLLEVGMQYIASAPDGTKMPFTITNVEGDDITIDFNHPLAGKDLEFDVELLDVRDATPEELAHGHVHGPDGHHHH